MKLYYRILLAILLMSVITAPATAEEKVFIREGANATKVMRTWNRYVAFRNQNGASKALDRFYSEWPVYRPVRDASLQNRLLGICRDVLEAENYGTREMAVVLLFQYRGYYFAAVDSDGEDLGFSLGYRWFPDKDCCYHLLAFDRHGRHVASFHMGEFIHNRITVTVEGMNFSIPSCQSNQPYQTPELSRDPPIEYPPAGKAMGLSGNVTVIGTIQPDGRVSDLKLVRWTNAIFNEATLQGLSRASFIPGRCNGTPTVATFSASVVFLQR